METLDYIIDKWQLDVRRRSPIEIPGVGRNDLAVLFGELGFRVGAEIGTEQGVYAEMLCRANPGLRLYCVDPWLAYRGYRDHVSQSQLDSFYEAVKVRLAAYDVRLVRAFSVEAAMGVEEGSLDFVYIDANHDLLHVIEDITAWAPKVRPGGIVSGHDYVEHKNYSNAMHVLPALQAYTRSYQVTPWFVLGTKLEVSVARDRPRSWL